MGEIIVIEITAKGSCQCGAIHYSLIGSSKELHHCHCSMCRKCHASMFGTYATIDRENFILDEGRENLSTHLTTPEVHRHFCSKCGSHVFIDVDWEPNLIWFTPGTLDEGHPGHPPESERHIWVGSKNPHYLIDDSLPKNEEF